MSYDEMELDKIGDRKTALFLIMSDTDTTFNFVIAMLQSQLFNLLCDKADVWGGYSPSGFDCSGFVSYCLVHSGVRNTGRLTAQGLYNICTPVSQSDAQPGDLIFFTGTYDAGEPVTHIGIYVGNGQMIHCGHPVQYTSINSPYWQSHFYGFGRW